MRVDLVEALAHAQTRVELRNVDFGTSEARPLLLEGWAPAEETDPRGETFVWALGEVSTIELFLLEPRPLELRFACRPFRFPGAPPQTLEVRIGEVSVVRLELAPKLAEYEVTVPAEALQAGRNVLSLHHGSSHRPRDVVPGSRDDRPLAAAWDWLRLGSAESAVTAPRADLERGLLALPAGAEVSYFLPLNPESTLVAERVGLRGGARLEVVLEPDGGPPGRLALIDDSEEAWRVELPAAELARLSLRALGSSEGEASVALVRPEVVSITEAAPVEPPTAPATVAERPDVVVYLIDTLRADHLGCYGYGRGTTPAIDAFAAEALLFEQMVAQSSWTKASVASIFTGLWPRDHAANTRADKLGDAATTLAERLHESGYATAAFVTNPNVTESFGFDQGFEEFRYLGAISDAEMVRQEVMAWLDARRDARPLFLYVHTLDPHSPYLPPEEQRRRFAPEVADVLATGGKAHLDDLQAGRVPVTETELARVRALYDAEIAFADWSFGRFLDDLRQRGRYEPALVALVSDHGEEFHEHGDFTHGRNLHVESLHVPLIVKPPGGGTPARVAAPVQHVDLLPTILTAAGLPVPAGLEGRDLLAVARGAVGERRIFSYLHLDGPARASVRAGLWKLLEQLDGEQLIWPRLYDLATDAGERVDLAEMRTVRTGFLAAALRRRLASTGVALDAETAIVDESLRESLRALGYVQ